MHVELHMQSSKGEILPLYYEVADTALGRRWYAALQKAVYENNPIRNHGEFHGFPGMGQTSKSLIRELNRQIDIVNQYKPDTISLRADSIELDQDHFNQLHKFFEELRGGVLSPARFFESAPDNVKKAIEEFNYLIHRFEAHVDHQKHPMPRFSMIFERFERWSLDDEDYEQFDLNRRFGQMYLHYCEVGKPILDVFFDQDTIVGQDNVRPLRFYSANCCFHFGKERSLERTQEVKTQLSAWMKEQGMNPADPKNAIGYATLGELDQERSFGRLNQDEIVNQLSGYLRIEKIELH